MKDILKNTNLRWTVQRQQIYDMVIAEKGHFTAENIWHRLFKKNIKTGLSTIYRTLQLLEEKNIIRRIPLDKYTAVYECKDGTAHGHHHLYCTKCGITLEMHDDMLENIENIIQEKYGFTVKSHTVMFNGLCAKCSNNE